MFDLRTGYAELNCWINLLVLAGGGTHVKTYHWCHQHRNTLDKCIKVDKNGKLPFIHPRNCPPTTYSYVSLVIVQSMDASEKSAGRKTPRPCILLQTLSLVARHDGRTAGHRLPRTTVHIGSRANPRFYLLKYLDLRGRRQSIPTRRDQHFVLVACERYHNVFPHTCDAVPLRSPFARFLGPIKRSTSLRWAIWRLDANID